MQGLYYLVPPDKHFPESPRSAGFLVSLVEEKTWNLGCLVPARMEDLCSSQAIAMHWICCFPCPVGGREDLECGLLCSCQNEKLCAVPR